MSTPLEKLSQRHYRILSLYMQGLKNVEIAAELSMTPRQVSNVVNSPSFQYQASRRRSVIEQREDDELITNDKKVADEIKKHTMQAVHRLVTEMDGPVAGDRIRASTELLDRGGFPRTQRTESRSVSVTIDLDTAKIIKETMDMEK